MKSPYKIAVLITLFTSSFITSQIRLKGNKAVTMENRNISDFNKIEVIDNVTVELSYNDNQNVQVKTDSNLQNAILTEVIDGVLTIKTSAKIIRKKELTIFINVNKNLKELYAYNNAKILSKNVLNIDSITINAFDKSDYSIKLNSKFVQLITKKTSDARIEVLCDKIFIRSEENSEIKCAVNSKFSFIEILDRSSINIMGNSTELSFEATGNSSFRGRDFKCLNVEARTANNTKSYINAGETINICATNSSEIYLYSNPKITLLEFFDKASLHKRDLDN